MNTFREYIEWVRRIDPLLDEFYVRREAAEQGAPLKVLKALDRERRGILSNFLALHPATDNANLFLGVSLEDSLGLLQSCDFKVTGRRDDAQAYFFDDSVKSTLYELLHADGLMSAQLFSGEAELLFYFNNEDTPVQRFKNRKDAERLGDISLERNPDLSFRVLSAVLLNPYGQQREIDTRREKEKLKEDTVIQLMERVIELDVPALYQNYVGSYCVVNPPRS